MDFQRARRMMVEEQLMGRDIHNKRVLWAMGMVPREEFVPDDKRNLAYIDSPVGIGYGQTISQPYIVALMCQLLELGEAMRVLDIGTGSGYEAAVLSLLTEKVYSLEINKDLADIARNRLARLGYKNVEVINQSGQEGWPKGAPYDGIKSAAAAAYVPEAWKYQLKDGAKLIMPIKRDYGQELIRILRRGTDFFEEKIGDVEFVSLVGE
jgi:protein-L-isoaspartate(D-aspartate) O-methyltransferase